MIHFTEQRQEILDALNRLSPDTLPAFGMMTPQHMVEHLSQAISISNGDRTIRLMVDEDRAAKQKRIMIYSDRPFPMGMQAPAMEGKLAKLRFDSLDEAKEELIRHMNMFDTWHRINPDAGCIHPFLGLLNHQEWVKFHSKHMTHHFKQFNLVA
jgi:hypothetical protein